MLCEKCSNIHFRRLRECPEIIKEPSRLTGVDERENAVYYFHHKSKDALQKSSENGCHFCAMLVNGLFGQPIDIIMSGKHIFARGEVILVRSVGRTWILDDGSRNLNLDDYINIKCEDINITSNIQTEFSDILPAPYKEYSGILKRMLNALTSCKNLSPQTGQSSSNHITARDEVDREAVKAEVENISSDHHPNAGFEHYSPWNDTSTMSLSNMVLATYWLQYCSLNHKACTDFRKGGRLPGRVIDVNDRQKPILVEGVRSDEPYITLSYKWGESRRYISTTENLTQHTKQGIPLEKLPQTFKDAIFVTNTLGFRWLWIDALCICQDLPDERDREMNSMDETFQNSAMTIFATAGEDADAGLMSIRDPRLAKPCKLRIRTTLDDQTIETPAYITIIGSGRTTSPLYSRGWALQEQVLSHRGLCFESRQLRWRCPSGEASETYPLQKGTMKTRLPGFKESTIYSIGDDGFNKLRLWIQHKNPMPDQSPWFQDNQFDGWYSMVTRYNCRALTYETDVLPALAGLSKAMATTHGCTYCAGLWTEDLQTGLCWYVAGPGSFQVPSRESVPSWSWISQRGREISFKVYSTHTTAKHVDISLPEHHRNRVSTLESSFTTITTKALMLTGMLRKVAVEKPPEREQDWKNCPSAPFENLFAAHWWWPIWDIKSNEMLGQITFDFDPATWESRDIYCLLCSAIKDTIGGQLICLGLVPTDATEEDFKRVGLVAIKQMDWFGELHLDDLSDEDGSRHIGRSGGNSAFVRTITLV